jgi:hypothetical protein
MECKLGNALGCAGLKVDGTCGIYSEEGVSLRTNQGVCIFKNVRAPRVGINAPKGSKMRNPLKAAKAAERGKAAQA